MARRLPLRERLERKFESDADRTPRITNAGKAQQSLAAAHSQLASEESDADAENNNPPPNSPPEAAASSSEFPA